MKADKALLKGDSANVSGFTFDSRDIALQLEDSVGTITKAEIAKVLLGLEGALKLDLSDVKTALNIDVEGTVYDQGGFYTASYFLAEGINCHSIWDLDEETGRFTAYDDTFANENGFIAAKGLKELDDTNLVAGNSLASKLGDTAAAVISGIWEYDVAKNRLKDNLGCAELPSFSVDGKSYHMGSFDGYKLMGVKPQVDAKKASVCRKLAKYLTGEICQTQRFKEVAWGPTNAVSSERDDVKAHPGLAALAKQHSYATQQGQCPGAWFVSLAAAAKEIKKDSSDARIREILAVYNSELPDLLSED